MSLLETRAHERIQPPARRPGTSGAELGKAIIGQKDVVDRLLAHIPVAIALSRSPWLG